MCGLVGIAGDLTFPDEQTFKRLLVLDTIRGLDSTGVAVVRNSGLDVRVAKTASHPFNLFDRKSFCDALAYATSKALIGHNRAATSGLIKEVNAHPFQFGHITGVHNGTLEDGDKKMLETMVGESFNVDSEALFAAFAKFGPKEVIPKLKKGKDHHRGAWSLVWWDAQKDTLNFLRNDHRPLWYCWSDDFKKIFWASEFWMLDAALLKAGGYKLWEKKSTKEKDKVFRFFQTSTDQWWSLDVSKLKKGGKEPPKFQAVPLAGKEPEAASERSYPFTNLREITERHGTGCGSNISPATRMQQLRKNSSKLTTKGGTTPRSSEPKVIHLLGDTLSPYANYLKEDEFSYIGSSRANGDPTCNWCGKVVMFGMPGITIFFKDNIVLCPTCSGHEIVLPNAETAPSSRFIVTREMFQQVR